MIALVDGNNFFVSCERVFNPSLEGKPVAVLSNNDGCVISRSNEFKSLKIAMGTPYFKIKNDIKRLGLILKSGNHELYGDLSRRLMQTLYKFAPVVEQYSVDEAFIHPYETPNWQTFGENMRKNILKCIGIPCGVGFAKTKTLAKIANHIGKKSASGVFVMPENNRQILANTPVGEIWGVGGNSETKLAAKGIHTALALSEFGDEKLHKTFGINMAKIAMELRGIKCIDDEMPDEPSQSLTYSRCFGKAVVDFEQLCESVATYLAKAAEKLRAEKQRASAVNIYSVYYPEYKPHFSEGGSLSATITFNTPTDNTIEMLKAVSPRIGSIFIKNRRYKKTGVVLFGLESGAFQGDLFSKNESHSKLFEAVDKLNRKFGKNSVAPLAAGLQKPWQTRRDMASPNYTTSWSDILSVK